MILRAASIPPQKKKKHQPSHQLHTWSPTSASEDKQLLSDLRGCNGDGVVAFSLRPAVEGEGDRVWRVDLNHGVTPYVASRIVVQNLRILTCQGRKNQPLAFFQIKVNIVYLYLGIKIEDTAPISPPPAQKNPTQKGTISKRKCYLPTLDFQRQNYIVYCLLY